MIDFMGISFRQTKNKKAAGFNPRPSRETDALNRLSDYALPGGGRKPMRHTRAARRHGEISSIGREIRVWANMLFILAANIRVGQAKTIEGFTLPISQVKKDEDGKWVAPGWLFKDRLDRSEKLARTTWHGMVAVTREIDEAAARLDAKIAQAKADHLAACRT